MKIEISVSAEASSGYLFDYDQPLTIRDFLDGSSLGFIPHIVLRGTYIPDTARCTSGTAYRMQSYVEPGYTQHSILIKCYADVRVNNYILGSGPTRLTALVDFRHYWDGYYARNAADLGMTEQQLIELFVEAHLSIIEHGREYAGGIYGREVLLFIGPAHDQATEVWEVFDTWDVQREDDETIIAVHPHRDDWRNARPDDYETHRSMLEMTLPAFSEGANTAHQARVAEYGGRVAPESIRGRAAGVNLPMLVTDAHRLTQFYRATGAYDDPDDPPAQPPPSAVTQCRDGGAVPRPNDNLNLILDCAALLRAKDDLRGTGTLNWSHETMITTWDGVTVDRDSDNALFVRDLALVDQGLNGFIPSALASLTALRRLDLDDNDLSGSLPPLLANLTSLQQVYLSGNSLSGPLPLGWADLPSLRFLFLNGNDLSGSLPPEWGGMRALRQLVLDGNGLSGEIPSEWGGMPSLEDLFLRENGLSGSIPAELESLSSLEELFLEGNAFTGCIPAGLRDVEAHDLTTLGLSYCAAGS